MIRPKSEEHAIACSDNSARMCVLRTLRRDSEGARWQAVRAVAYASLTEASILVTLSSDARYAVQLELDTMPDETASAQDDGTGTHSHKGDQT